MPKFCVRCHGKLKSVDAVYIRKLDDPIAIKGLAWVVQFVHTSTLHAEEILSEQDVFADNPLEALVKAAKAISDA